ncbi:SpoIIE family protein phosphatase [Geodermatophilus obscurus]|uniref:Putative PAS/PAC sensor protein n=1 Tax=Geodermatophilus obscurus (strain ATCC 25078 / DSM 43160 / JCM 3152 / CCUG 61914 / KCC A-0152 / KCTC 9177 / NBRC 13315 / NRRL B-3577 / G-20) TaxID=526225 RepID=D2SAD9_GEOOG|nr:SpoIIE family protein phosphatase [Geodermatophilus obscurus]ADB73868.1 putative PAS/PAC sensor protein [Geodermatophilus obscurus DSM 43160]
MALDHEVAVSAPSLLGALPDAVVVADRAGRIAYVNPAIRVLLGHEPEDLVGQPLTVLMPERLRHGHGAGFARYAATGEGKLVGATTQLPALHAAGHEVAIDLTLSRLRRPATVAGDPLVVAVLRDASTTILLERQFEVSRYLAATLRVTAALTEARDADVAFRDLLPTLCTELDWDTATLWQPDRTTGTLSHAGTWTAPGQEPGALHTASRELRFRRGTGLPGIVWTRRSPVAVENLWEDPSFIRAEAARADGIRSGVAFPVVHGDELLAVCELFSREERPVPAELLDVLAHAGRQIGQFLGRLRAESEVRRLADTLQRSLLPSHLPAIRGVQLAARYRPGGGAGLVGGDTYDVMPLPDGRWMVLIADVCGTGAEAAAVTALTRHTARAAASPAAETTAGPAEVLRAVNAALLREQTGGPLRFVTAVCLMLSPGPGGVRATVGVAGHPLPVLACPDGPREVGVPGHPLGISPDLDVPVVEVELPPGTTMVLYTDGVTEARDDTGAQFGDEGLLRVLGGLPGDAEATVEAVTAAVEERLRHSRYEADDLAVLALAVPA